MAAVLPASKVGSLQRVGSKYVTSYSTHWPCYFPQPGPGKKHERAIVLERWQEGLVDDEPRAFLRGLLHSDGCRVVNRVAGREYPRYMFTNYSQDIKALFTMVCDGLGVEWRPMGLNNIAVSRRASVRFLDEFVGPKY